MVRPMQIIHASNVTFSPIPLAIGLFVSVSLLVSLCAKHYSRHQSKKYTSKTSDHSRAKVPLPSPKQLITTISHKAMMVNAKKSSSDDHGVRRNNEGDEESGVWQKAILMGEKCQPPEFSGVIYYDYSGNRVPEMPKSPRHTSMTPLKNLTMQKSENSMY